MTEFNSSLLREKFTIHDRDINAPARSVIALSNRMVVDIVLPGGRHREHFIVRTHNMHGCARMAARMLQSFYQNGPLLDRPVPYDWEAAWDSIVSDYEYAYNSQRWLSVYTGGRAIFQKGMHHALLDVIEKCEARNKGGLYEESIKTAEAAFRDLGKDVTIEYDANVALVVDFEDDHGRCAIILRGPDKTTTFNFTATARPGNDLGIPQCLSAAAAFLEGIQLAFLVGMNTEKIKLGMIERHSKEEKQTAEARKRLARLGAEIANLEASCAVHYRPERPEFPHLIMDAEKLAEKMLKRP